MNRLLLLLLMCVVALSAKCFTLDLNKWDAKQIAKAHKASRGIFSTARERELIFYCNLARMNGPLFIRTILKPFLEESGDTTFSDYKQSLVVALNRQQKNKQPLHYSMVMNIMAKSYAAKAGRRGYVGHNGIDKRFSIQRALRHTYGENCSYGEYTGLDVAISLLIDEGVPNLGHRLNILNTDFKKVGAGFAKHSKYHINAVMEFVGN